MPTHSLPYLVNCSLLFTDEPLLREGSSSVQQQALRDFDRALAAFFDPGNPAGKPKFRGKRGSQGFVIRDVKARRVSGRWGEVQAPTCGWVRFRWTRSLPAKPGMARVTLDRSGRWHVSFPAPQPAVRRQGTGSAVVQGGDDVNMRIHVGRTIARDRPAQAARS